MFSPSPINNIYFWKKQTLNHCYVERKGETMLLMKRFVEKNEEDSNYFWLVLSEKSKKQELPYLSTKVFLEEKLDIFY